MLRTSKFGLQNPMSFNFVPTLKGGRSIVWFLKYVFMDSGLEFLPYFPERFRVSPNFRYDLNPLAHRDKSSLGSLVATP